MGPGSDEDGQELVVCRRARGSPMFRCESKQAWLEQDLTSLAALCEFLFPKCRDIHGMDGGRFRLEILRRKFRTKLLWPAE